MPEDYYKTLGVNRDASQAEIQKAYRELARKYHPDLNPDDKAAKQRFQELQTAFDVLNDSSKRELYDRYGSSFEQYAGNPRGGGSTRGSQGTAGAEGFDFSQFFGERYGGDSTGGFADIFSQFRRADAGGNTRGRRARKSRGSDIEHRVPIPFATAINGGQVQISVQRQSGKVDTLNVKIPQGIASGKKIRLRGQGESGPGGAHAGEILLTVDVQPHPCFTRIGNNLHVKVPVTLSEAALGAKVDVPTPGGLISLGIPPATSSGTKLRVKGQGVSASKSAPGDLIAEIQIVLPDSFDEASQELIRKLDAGSQLDPRANLHW